MLRDVGLEDISDGRLYRENDMVKTDTNSCQGCKKICCIGMGRTIVLDPYDCTGLELAQERHLSSFWILILSLIW